MDLYFTEFQPALLVMAFFSLGLLATGYFWRDRRGHLFSAAGWVLFGLYWPFQSYEFFVPTTTTEPDPVNGWFTLLGPLFLWFIAYHEYRSYQWDEDPHALRWFGGASVLAAVTYFLVYEIDPIGKWIIYQTAEQSAFLYNWIFFGGDTRATVSVDSAGESHIFLPGGEYAVTVVFACTAIQSIMIFVGAIWAIQWKGEKRADASLKRRKMLAYLYTVPVIYFLNLFRNAGIVYGYKDLGWGMFGFAPFEWMHSYVGKIGSLIAMIFIALAVFATLPELHNNILDLFDLRKRRAPGFFGKKPPPEPAQQTKPAESQA